MSWSRNPLVIRMAVLGIGMGVMLGGDPSPAAWALDAVAPSVSTEGRTSDLAATWQDGVCRDDDPTDADLAAPGTPVEVGGITVRLDAPDDPSVGPRELTVRVDDEGDPLAGALVFVTIRMPSMDHGVSAYPAMELGGGNYRAEEVSLGMGGEWVVSVEVIRQARAPISVAYRLEVSEP